MTNIIDFAAALNARRAAAQQAAIDAAAARRAAEEREQIAQTLGGGIGAQIIADVVAELRQEKRTDLRPAYCDPSNEVRGSKYEATRDLRHTEIAQRIRADIKAAGLPAGVKVSVRCASFSGGCSIDVRVTALPADMPVLSAKAASWRKQYPRKDYPFAYAEAVSDEVAELLEKIQRIHAAYNRDNSDSMTDYADVRFYGDVMLHWELQRDLEARDVAASDGAYWTEDLN